ncbi:hypothetical protein N7451_008181 [Penicillium sp. IBT 35674x]|nr:hypothetical protein N7451_008181 [Penicillium sp. IBT 35674x]
MDSQFQQGGPDDNTPVLEGWGGINIPTLCEVCSDSTTKQCSGCIDGPGYPTPGLINIYYCSLDCQQVDWPWHQELCRRLKLRTKIHRIATLLKAVMLAYREVVYDMDITDITSKDGMFRFVQISHTGNNCLHRVHAPFPNNITTNSEHKEVALLFEQGTAAMALLSRLTKKLLIGLDVTLVPVEIIMKKPKMPARVGPGRIPEYFPHTVWLMDIDRSDEVWILDPTGAQYGIQDVFVPWKHYMKEYECRFIGHYPYHRTETGDLDYFATLPEARKLATKIAVERQARIVFSSFVDYLVIGDLLDVSEPEFKRRVKALQENLKEHMSMYFHYKEANA